MVMKKWMLPLWVVVAALGATAGFWVGLHKAPQQETASEGTLSAVPDAPKTDSFTLKLFQMELADSRKANTTVAPYAMAELLHTLAPLLGGESQEEWKRIGLPDMGEPPLRAPALTVLRALDKRVATLPGAPSCLPLPMAEDLPLALSLFNRTLAEDLGYPNAIVASTTMVPAHTKLLLGATTHLKAEWTIPFNAGHTQTADFYNANGAMPHHQQMHNRGQFQTAEAADGSWKAVKIPLNNGGDKDSATLSLTLIMPHTNARELATSLTPEFLNLVRKELANSRPKDCEIKMPRISFTPPSADVRQLFRQLGLKSIYDTETADFSPLTPDKITMGAAVFAFSLELTENDKTPHVPQPEGAETGIVFDHPFIWFISEEESNYPFYFMGMVENL